MSAQITRRMFIRRGPMSRAPSSVLITAVATLMLAACQSNGSSGDAAAGGASSTGGLSGGAGTIGSGGRSGGGGLSGSGGRCLGGGGPAAGGSSGVGGVLGSGGSSRWAVPWASAASRWAAPWAPAASRWAAPSGSGGNLGGGGTSAGTGGVGIGGGRPATGGAGMGGGGGASACPPSCGRARRVATTMAAAGSAPPGACGSSGLRCVSGACSSGRRKIGCCFTAAPDANGTILSDTWQWDGSAWTPGQRLRNPRRASAPR